MRIETSLPKFVGILFLLLGAVCHGQVNTLQVGSFVPDFECLDERGNLWKFSDHVGTQAIVLYFYPSDFDFCSTLQATRYRSSHEELVHRGATVVGISGDTVRCHRLFKDTHQLRHTLLADENGTVASLFGVPLRDGGKAMVKDADGQEIIDNDGHAMSIPRKVTAKRCTFIIDQCGYVIYRATSVSPVLDCKEVLQRLP